MRPTKHTVAVCAYSRSLHKFPAAQRTRPKTLRAVGRRRQHRAADSAARPLVRRSLHSAEYVYVLRRGTLYQFAAYDLTIVKKLKLESAVQNRRAGRRRQDGEPGDGGNGGRGGDGGSAWQSSGSVTAHGDYVYVLQNSKMFKFLAKGLKEDKIVTLDFGNHED